MGSTISYYSGLGAQESTSDNTEMKDVSKLGFDQTKESLLNKIEQLQKMIVKQESQIKLLREKDVVFNPSKQYLEDIKQAKKAREYEGAVFSGGGTKGIAYCGLMKLLDELKVLYNDDGSCKLNKFAGASVGSIFAAAVALGFTPAELEEKMKTLDLQKVVSDDNGYIREGLNFEEDWGFCRGNYIYEFMGEVVVKKMGAGNEDYTIKQLYDDHGIQLVIVGTDMNYKNSVYFWHGNPIKEYSEIPIRKAVRASMSIPYLFTPEKVGDDIFVDGGVLDNFPLHVFDGEYPGDVLAKNNLVVPNPKIVGFQIITDNNQLDYQLTNRQDFNHLMEYSTSFISMFLTNNARTEITPAYWLRTIHIITPDLSLTDFSITDEQKQELINDGYDCAKEFFE